MNKIAYSLMTFACFLLGCQAVLSAAPKIEFETSPAISYAAQSGYKWIYVVSRSDYDRGDGKGTLLAFRQNKN